jgi:predicted O-methyltransferase YrrM
MSLQEKYNQAKEHKENHTSCGGEPYKSFEKLFQILNGFEKPLKVLEIGTAVGFTTFILQNKVNSVDTIELHQEHIDLAKENIASWGGELGKINFISGDAKDILPTLEANTYDLIFFDGYGAKYIYYPDFLKLLKQSGMLITANKFLKSTEVEYFNELENTQIWKFLEEFGDTKVHIKL